MSRREAIPLDWQQAQAHLEAVEHAYRQVFFLRVFLLPLLVRPLRRRLEAGERSLELYGEIMDLEA